MSLPFLRVSVLGKAFGIDKDHPLTSKHPNFQTVKAAVDLLVRNARQSYNGAKDQWNFAGLINHLPPTLRSTKGGTSWYLPKDPFTPGEAGFIATPIQLDGRPQRLASNITQVRAPEFVFVDLDLRPHLLATIQRAFERTYGKTVIKVHDHPNYSRIDEYTGYCKVDDSWVYVETDQPVKLKPLFILPEDIVSEEMGPLLKATLWQEPMLTPLLVKPHRGCGYCHGRGHTHKACDALKQHRKWIKKCEATHPLYADIEASVAAEVVEDRPAVPEIEEDEEAPPSEHPQQPEPVREELTYVNMEGDRVTSRFGDDKIKVPKYLPEQVYDALQAAYAAVATEELGPLVDQFLVMLQKSGILAPARDSRGAGPERQREVLMDTIRIILTKGGKGFDSRRPTQVESYFRTLVKVNPYKPVASEAAASSVVTETSDPPPKRTSFFARSVPQRQTTLTWARKDVPAPAATTSPATGAATSMEAGHTQHDSQDGDNTDPTSTNDMEQPTSQGNTTSDQPPLQDTHASDPPNPLGTTGTSQHAASHPPRGSTGPQDANPHPEERRDQSKSSHSRKRNGSQRAADTALTEGSRMTSHPNSMDVADGADGEESK